MLGQSSALCEVPATEARRRLRVVTNAFVRLIEAHGLVSFHLKPVWSDEATPSG